MKLSKGKNRSTCILTSAKTIDYEVHSSSINVTNPLSIFLLDVNFKKLTLDFMFLLYLLCLWKFIIKNKKSIAISLIKFFNFKFLWYKIMHKKWIY